MRDYSQFDKNLSDLSVDIYSQHPDPAHINWAIESLKLLPNEVDTVLDVGAGTAFIEQEFASRGIVYTGLTLGNETQLKNRQNILFRDFSFTGLPDEFCDLVYARHSLEHSPFPLLTLMEWHRVSDGYLLLVAPAPEYWGYYGQNHYSVMNEDQLWWSLRRSGWKIAIREYLRTDDEEFLQFYLPEKSDRSMVEYPGPPKLVEYRYLCKKVDPIRK